MARLEPPVYVSAYLKREEGTRLKQLNHPRRDLWIRFSLIDSLQGRASHGGPFECIEGELSNIVPYSNGHVPPEGYERCLVIFRPASDSSFHTSAKNPCMINIAVKKKGGYVPLSELF